MNFMFAKAAECCCSIECLGVITIPLFVADVLGPGGVREFVAKVGYDQSRLNFRRVTGFLSRLNLPLFLLLKHTITCESFLTQYNESVQSLV